MIPVKQAVGQSLAEWSGKFEEFFGGNTSGSFRNPSRRCWLRRRPTAATTWSDYKTPAEEPAWTQGLKDTLSAEQASSLEKDHGRAPAIRGERVAEFLKPMLENARDEFATQMLAKTGEIKAALAPSKETAGKLDALAKTAADRMVEVWQKRAAKSLLALDDDVRRKTLKNNRNGNFGMFFGGEESDGEAESAAWDKDLGSVLSPEEAKRWRDVVEEHEARQAQAMGRALIAELDQKVAFTASQREKLHPVAERVLREQSSRMQNEMRASMFAYNGLQTILSAAATFPDAELKPILDPVQLRRWQEFSRPQGRIMAGSRAQKPAGKPEESPAPEPEEQEHMISDFLFENATSEYRSILAEITLKIEDAARIVALSQETSSRLQIAARGAAERSIEASRDDTERNVRANLGAVPGQNVQERLAMLGQNFNLRFNERQVELAIWNKAVETELTADQRASWQKELDERQRYLDESIVQIVIAGFDALTSLSAEQSKKIEPLVAGFMKDYGPDIGTIFGNYGAGQGNVWYMQAYRCLPFSGVPEKDLKEILSKEQWEQWAASNEFSNCNNLWSNLQRNHEQRLKTKK